MDLNSIQQLSRLKQILEIEKEEDRRFYHERMSMFSLEKRRERGICWYPVVMNGDRYGMGGRLIIETERTKGRNQHHLLQSGSPAMLFGARDGKELYKIPGVVHKVQGDVMSIAMHNDDLPSWVYELQLGVYLSFDETSYREMNITLDKVISAKKDRPLFMRELLHGDASPEFQSDHYPIELPGLNDSQNEAVNKVLAAEDLAIIHGPPGTGKTTTMVAAVEQTLKHEKQVLVCCPSNNAVDLMTEKLSEKGITVTRIGHPSRVSEHLQDCTLDGRLAEHPDYKEYRHLLRKSEEMKRQAKKFKRKFGHQEKRRRKEFFAEAKAMKSEAADLEDYMVYDIFKKSQVITSTLVSVGSYLLRDKKFSTVFIDEAAQALEPAAWIPVLRSRRLVMAGDHQQLPPTIKSVEAAKKGLENTLFSKALAHHPQTSVMLRTQYRMNEKIMQFSNEKFYEGKLEAHESVRNHRISENEEPLLFVDTAGCDYTEKQDEDTLSRYNDDEADLLIRLLKDFLNGQMNNPETLAKLEKLSVGLIAPYKAQVYKLRDRFADDEFFRPFDDQVSIHTVDGFQGQERDAMFISLVRSNKQGEIGFLKDIRRTNVAMTRARKKLVLVGDSATLGGDPFYSDMITYFEKENALRSAYEFMTWE